MIILHFHRLDERAVDGRPVEYVQVFDGLPGLVSRTPEPGFILVSETDPSDTDCPTSFPWGSKLEVRKD